MKHQLTGALPLTAIAFALFAATTLPARAAQCSLASVAGSYGYTTSGFIASSAATFLPVAAVGRITFDGHGNVSGSQTRVVAGSPLRRDVFGNLQRQC